MHILNHLFDNPIIGIGLIAVLLIFLVAIAFAVYASIKNRQGITGNNFTYVATAIAGLVLSVASGVIGAPATVQLPADSLTSQRDSGPSNSESKGQEGKPTTVLQARLANDQITAFRTIYAWAYVLAGLVCLVVFICPTPFTHDLVKSVGLTTLGFLITIVGGIAQPSQLPPNQQVHVKITESA
jgi:hypothetical protein